MNGQPNARQKRFHEWCREQGCIITGAPNPSIHHIKGSRMKLKGCKNPGEDYVLPLCYDYHQGVNGVHTNKRKFVEKFGTEKTLWLELVNRYTEQFGKLPLPASTYNAILDRA